MTPFLYSGLTRLTQLWLFGEAIGDASVRWPDATHPSHLVPNAWNCPAVQVTGIASLQLKNSARSVLCARCGCRSPGTPIEQKSLPFAGEPPALVPPRLNEQ